MKNQFSWPLMDDNVTLSDRKALSDFILSDQKLTNGEKIREFEKKWSEWLGVDHSVMVNSGSSANFISIAIVKELFGTGEVIVPPLGWVSDISSVAQLGMTPVFVDIQLKNLAIDYRNIKKAITKKTKAIVLVHCLGFNGINQDIINLAKDKNIFLIEDCCESHGATYREKKVGNFGNLSLFSFYFSHHMTTIEGGILCTNDKNILDLAKLFRSHGMTREASDDLQNEYQKEYPNLNPLFTFAVAGFNMRATEFQGVLGLEQLKRLDGNIERRRENLLIWLGGLDRTKYFTGFDLEGSSNLALPLVLMPNVWTLWNNICDLLDNEGVEYRIGMAGGGNQANQPYLKKFKHRISESLDNANYVHLYSLYIGNYNNLKDGQILDLCKKLNDL